VWIPVGVAAWLAMLYLTVAALILTVLKESFMATDTAAPGE